MTLRKRGTARFSPSRSGVRWTSLAAAGIAAGAGFAVSSYRRDIADARRRVGAAASSVLTSVGRIEYADAGRGEPVLTIHGAGGGWDQGEATFRGFVGANGFRVIAPSRFGYLGTPLPVDASPAAQADAHAALLDAIGVERVAVIAASAGAPSAMQFALRHPHRTASLVLLVPDTWAPPAERSGEKLMASPFIQNVVLRSDFALWSFIKLARREMITFLGVPRPLQPTMTAAEEAGVDELMQTILPVSRRRAGIVNDGNNSRALGRYPLEQIRAPTLIVDAADVSTFPGSKYTAVHIPGARFVWYESGGHLLVGHEEDCRRVVTEFLRAHPVEEDAARAFIPAS